MDVKAVDTKYPVIVQYCGVCGLPPEFCEYGPSFAKCKVWISQNCGEVSVSLTGTEGLSDPTEEKVQKLPGGKIKKTEAPSVTITTAARTKRKHTTTITGLKGFGISLESASKGFRGKFACGASITKGKDEIVIQGDVKDELYDILVTVYKKEIPKDAIFFQEEKGKKTAAGGDSEDDSESD